uniref:Uncharacterized protein n=1 Tax=viral metagenome TaxID=1070528 RepID=A0A6C0CBT1_9ZZZZ
MAYRYCNDTAVNFHACKNSKNLCYDEECHRCKQIFTQMRELKRINDEMLRLAEESNSTQSNPAKIRY